MGKVGNERSSTATRRPRPNRASRLLTGPVNLSRDTLQAIPRTVKTPAYDVASLSAGIVHFGVGNFHRSHQAVYLDALFNLGLDHDWAIIGAGVRSADEE